MPVLYEFKKIEGKGFGCVAGKAIKKGTVIFQEAPECVAEGALCTARTPTQPNPKWTTRTWLEYYISFQWNVPA